mgnify:CR=1 FL=1
MLPDVLSIRFTGLNIELVQGHPVELHLITSAGEIEIDVAVDAQNRGCGAGMGGVAPRCRASPEGRGQAPRSRAGSSPQGIWGRWKIKVGDSLCH